MTLDEHFLRADAWPLLLAGPALFALLVWLGGLHARATERVLGVRVAQAISERARPVRRAQRALFATGISLALVALLGPTWGDARAAGGRRGVDVVVCLDVSRSMLAQDHEPTRLSLAQRAIAELSDVAGGDRLALVLFAGDAVLSVPLTHDSESLVRLASEASPLSVERGGTDLGAALDVALGALAGTSGEHETIVLLTDGDDVEARGLAAAGRAAARGITVHCIGYGSRLGSKIAVDGKNGAAFIRDGAGKDVVSALDEIALGRISEATGGVFRAAVDQKQPLIAVYEEEVVPMARKAFEEDEQKQRKDRFQWPLAAAFGLLLMVQCLTERRAA